MKHCLITYKGHIMMLPQIHLDSRRDFKNVLVSVTKVRKRYKETVTEKNNKYIQ